jgi:hypothetical protein
MVAFFHAGGWDELLIALVAFGVLWGAVKLAGRKSADADDEDDDDEGAETEKPDEVATPPASRIG